MLRRICLRAFVLTVGLLSIFACVAPVAGQGLVWTPRRPKTTKIPTTVQAGWKVEVRKPGDEEWTVNSTYSNSARAKAAAAVLYGAGNQVRLTKYETLTFRRARATSVQPKLPYPDAIDWASALTVFRKMESLGDRVAFRFPADGCYARAHIMAQEMRKMDLHPWKVWSTHNGRELLYAKTTNHPRGYVTWGWHVAPVLRVKLSSGKVIWCVFDPSLATRPSSLTEWKKVQTRPGARVSPNLEVTAPGRAPLWNNKRVGPGYTVSDDVPQYRIDEMAQAKMRQYKPYQGKWHPRLDKDAPEWVKSSGSPHRTGLLGKRGSPAPQKSATRAALGRQRRS